jgi:uncharacterized membrane protein
MQETRTRSLVKTILWRIIATGVTLFVAYGYTRSLSGAGEIALTAAIISMIAYYIHERLWNKTDWGRK